MTIGENIKKYRKMKKMTQKQLSDLINKGIRTLQKYENGDITPPIKVLADIAFALGVPIKNIIGDDDNYKEYFNGYSISIRFLDIHQLPNEKEQIIKVVEEMYEFLNAAGDENQLEEFYDLVQASLNLLQIRNFTLKEIQEAEQKHIEKLRKRGWEIE